MSLKIKGLETLQGQALIKRNHLLNRLQDLVRAKVRRVQTEFRDDNFQFSDGEMFLLVLSYRTMHYVKCEPNVDNL